ncbi:unnamed protein product, partial [Darwinula stevensoni]
MKMSHISRMLYPRVVSSQALPEPVKLNLTELRLMHMEGKQHGFSREALQSDITRVLKDVEDDTELFKRLFSSYPVRIKALRDRGRITLKNSPKRGPSFKEMAFSHEEQSELIVSTEEPALEDQLCLRNDKRERGGGDRSSGMRQ